MTTRAPLTQTEAREWLELDEIYQRDRPYLIITDKLGRYHDLGRRAAASGMSITDIRNRAKEATK